MPLVFFITFSTIGDLKVIGTFHLSLVGELANYNQNFYVQSLMPLVFFITFSTIGDLKVIGTFHLSLVGELANLEPQNWFEVPNLLIKLKLHERLRSQSSLTH
jgi:hypothetical protein